MNTKRCSVFFARLVLSLILMALLVFGTVQPAHATTTVSIDIDPGSSQNYVDRTSTGNITVAVFGSNTFDVNHIDPVSTQFAGAGPNLVLTQHVNDDGIPDVLFHFAIQALNLPDGMTEACLIGDSSTGTYMGCDAVTFEAPPNTPAGTNVQTQPIDTTGGTTPVTLTFAQVTQGGTTSLTTSSSGPPPSVGFKLGNPATYYELSTTAVFSGPVTICIDYAGISFSNESTLKLNHYENGAWVDQTISLDTTNNVICASVTSLSPFAIFEAGNQFSGFFQPVDNLPTLNVVKAGSAIPVKFSLNGDQGLDIFAAGYPSSGLIDCDTGVPQDAIEVTVTAGNSSLSYNAATDTYTYTWKTDRAWTGCRQLVVRLNDGTDHVVNFKFR